ncbi:hypothetical protein ACTJK9_29580, partial [Pseudomonas sp. 22082]|uniref:hypothetical protein n=1 Tax=Pseudomonas sp. 22082 TaxID=3453868 RepID=UPI003F85C053
RNTGNFLIRCVKGQTLTSPALPHKNLNTSSSTKANLTCLSNSAFNPGPSSNAEPAHPDTTSPLLSSRSAHTPPLKPGLKLLIVVEFGHSWIN